MTYDKETVLAFDIETARLATEVAKEFAEELAGESPWSRPDLFGFGVGVVVDISTDVAYRHRDPERMIEHLKEADLTVGYNTFSFDLGALSAYGEVEGIRARHTDLNLLVRDALDELPEVRNGDRIRQGGLDGLARANGLVGKTGTGTHAPELLREGKVEEVLNYCEHDVRLVAELYRMARQTGRLFVNGYRKVDGEKVELGRLEVPIPVHAY